MTTIPPCKLTILIRALKAMTEEDMTPAPSELIRLAEAIDAKGVSVAQLHPLHMTDVALGSGR